MDEPMEGCLEIEQGSAVQQQSQHQHTGHGEKDGLLPSAGDANNKAVGQGYYSPLLRPGSMGVNQHLAVKTAFCQKNAYTSNWLHVLSIAVGRGSKIAITKCREHGVACGLMMTLTEEDYEMQYWPKLKTAIDQLLNMKPMSYIPISYEQMYSCVYKCVCKQFSERLYNDLLQHLTFHMDFLNQELNTHASDSIDFINNFSFLMHQYLHALSGIVPIFNYMNRFYVENKLQTDLNEELRKLFRTQVVDTHIDMLIKRLDEAISVPFSVPPPTMASIIKNLFELNQNYSKLNPSLFSRYLPNILPPSDPSLLEQYALEARTIQSLISRPQDNQSHNSSRKREYEGDTSGN